LAILYLTNPDIDRPEQLPVFPENTIFGPMDQKPRRRELEERLARCRKLEREVTTKVSAKNLQELVAELEQAIRTLDQGTNTAP
jgi:hypothetical protein